MILEYLHFSGAYGSLIVFPECTFISFNMAHIFDGPILGRKVETTLCKSSELCLVITDSVFYSLVFQVGNPTLFAVFFDL